ncbi:hypothetical protein HaLaN_32292, partial [Haematococcus lacustris]
MSWCRASSQVSRQS